MTVLLASTIGGHLQTLYAAVQRIEGLDLSDRRWVTHESAHARSLLTGEDVTWVDYIDERDLSGVVREARHARKLLSASTPEAQIDTVISAGSAIACAYLPLAALQGKRSIYIEGDAFWEQPSRTGRLMAATPRVETLTESDSVAAESNRWRAIGSPLDRFSARPADQAPKSLENIKRIVVTVGTSKEFGFRRLLEQVLSIVDPETHVVWQTGCTKTNGLGINARKWIPHDELAEEMANADAVIAHAGAGSAQMALEAGKVPILIPRDPDFNEFNDRHQEQLAKRLSTLDLARSKTLRGLNLGDLLYVSSMKVDDDGTVAPIDLSVPPDMASSPLSPK